MRATYGEGRKVCDLFFAPLSGEENVYLCKCGTRRKRTGSSYANLLSHVRSAHPDYNRLLNDTHCDNQSSMKDFVNTTKAGNFYGWFDLVINGLLPFSTVENKLFQGHVKHSPISISTFMRYLPRLAEVMEKKISNLLPDKLALIIDVWTSSSTHYLAVFASYRCGTSNSLGCCLLTVSPMGDEFRLNSDEHISFLDYILNLYGKSWDNVVALVGDNCSVNKSISTKSGVPLVGCASHRFNLSVQDILMEEFSLIMKMNDIMIKLRTLLLSAKLRKLTPLHPRLRNETRWSSTYEMILRYQKLRQFLPCLNSPEVDELLLTPGENRRVDALCTRLAVLDSVTKALQKESTSLSDVRALFEAVMDQYPESVDRLASNAEIVHCAQFESAVVKVQNGNIESLSREERNAIVSLRIPNDDNGNDERDELSFVQRALKRRKYTQERSAQLYLDTSFILSTSNVCERLLSTVGHALSDLRRGLTPANLESQIFLRANKDLWSAADINEIGLA